MNEDWLEQGSLDTPLMGQGESAYMSASLVNRSSKSFTTGRGAADSWRCLDEVHVFFNIL